MSSTPSVPVAAEIPDGFVASFKSWLSTGNKESELAEQRILSRLSTFRSPHEADTTTPHSANARVSQVQLHDKGKYINMLSIQPTSPAVTNQDDKANQPPTTVILHGYGAGLGFFSLNMESLSSWSSKRGLPIYLLDWLGMGRSSRPPFKITAKHTDTRARVQQAENFFLDSLEEWRVKMGIEKMTLVGHSLGAYLVTAYALRWPERVARLVLLSPAGVNQGENSTVPEEELTRSRTNPEAAETRGAGKEVNTSNPKDKDVQKIKEEQEEEKSRRRDSWGRRLFVHAWEAGYSPFGLLRALGPWGPSLVGRYTSRRFADLDPAYTRDLHQYLLQISLARGSGEYALSHLLAPMAHARLPLEFRVAQLPKDLPVTFVYGSHDWMDPEGGMRSVQRLKEKGNTKSRMVIVPGAGHHVYLDNPDVVNELLVKELDAATRSWRRSQQ